MELGGKEWETTASFLIKMQQEQGLAGLQRRQPEGRLSLEGTTQVPGRVSLGLSSQEAAALPCKGHSGSHTPTRVGRQVMLGQL